MQQECQKLDVECLIDAFQVRVQKVAIFFFKKDSNENIFIYKLGDGINNMNEGKRNDKVDKVSPNGYLSELLHVNYDVQS